MIRRSAAGLIALTLIACGDGTPQPEIVATANHPGLTCDACHAGAVTDDFVAPATTARCIACHVPGTVAENVAFANVSFSHLDHPTLPDGSPLPCSTCHDHATATASLGINTASCFLCHAERPAAGVQAVSATMSQETCADCHIQPTHTAFARTGAPIDHATVLERGVSCLLCHYDVVSGTGEVAEASCRGCHSVPGGPPPARPGPPGDADSMHQIHSDDGEIACNRCHVPVQHDVVQLATALVLDCEGCHAPDDPALDPPVDPAVHRPEQLLYSGLDPHHPESTPAVKFTARVACAVCHPTAATNAGGGTETALRAMNAECIACHGDRFGRLLRPWLGGMAAHTSAVGTFVRSAAGDARLRRFAEADSLVREAGRIWAFVDSAHGVHNLPGADGLLRTAVDAAERAYQRAGIEPPPRPRIGPDPEIVTCAGCHYGIELQSSPIYGQTFDHGRHMTRAGLACGACHSTAELFEADGRTFDPGHGTTHVTAANCASCHHVERAGVCAECHLRPSLVALDIRAEISVSIPFGNRTNTRSVDFAHEAHAGITCESCHAAATATRPAEDCAGCHVEHHEQVDPAGCAVCHGSNVRSLHQRVDHLACGGCHTTSNLRLLGVADRAFCLQCHANQREHQPGGECSTCHLLRTPEEAMQAILSRTTPPRGGG